VAKATTKRPTRDEFELEELGNRIVEAKDNEENVTLNVWGSGNTLPGKIVELDARKRQIRLETSEGSKWIPFLDIMKVEGAN
jgi:predicted RNA-binding protein